MGCPHEGPSVSCPDKTNSLTSGVTSPLQGAEQLILHFSPLKRRRDPGSQTIGLPSAYPVEVQNHLFSPLKRGRDPGSQTMCLPPGYPGKAVLSVEC